MAFRDHFAGQIHHGAHRGFYLKGRVTRVINVRLIMGVSGEFFGNSLLRSSLY